VLNAATYEREMAERAYRELIETSKQIEMMIAGFNPARSVSAAAQAR